MRIAVDKCEGTRAFHIIRVKVEPTTMLQGTRTQPSGAPACCVGVMYSMQGLSHSQNSVSSKRAKEASVRLVMRASKVRKGMTWSLKGRCLKHFRSIHSNQSTVMCQRIAQGQLLCEQLKAPALAKETITTKNVHHQSLQSPQKVAASHSWIISKNVAKALSWIAQ